jgi:hypothetical protein
LTREAWERLHGPGTETVYGVEYEDGRYYVNFVSGRVWNIVMEWYEEDDVNLEEARGEGDQLLPADSQFVETYSPEDDPELAVDLYYSESLRDRFGPGDDAPDDLWPGGGPGDFIVWYEVIDQVVYLMVIDTGNSP